MNDDKMNTDTENLLKECDAGTKMAVASFDEVLERIEDSELKQLLSESKEHHESLGDEIHSELLSLGSDDKEPNPMAKGMSWMKTNMMLAANESDQTVADLMTDGCDMGIKSLYRYLNQYEQADDSSVSLCKKLIQIEEELRKNMQEYL